MPGATITSKGQVTVPKEIRDVLGLRSGDRIAFRIRSDGTVILEPETIDVMSLRGALRSGGRHLTIDAMNEVVRKVGAKRGRTRPAR